MKPLTTRDLGLFSRIVAKMDIRKDITGMFRTMQIDKPERPKGMSQEEYKVYVEEHIQAKAEEANRAMMADLLIILIENYHKAEKEVYTLLAGLSDQSVADIEELPLKGFIELLKELLEDESIIDFFNLVAE